MDIKLITKLKSLFDSLAHETQQEHVEFWLARELQEPLGYARWANFTNAINKAIESCITSGCNPGDHFRGVTKMVAECQDNVR